MATVNKVILIGFVGADPDVRYKQNGDAVVVFNLATNEKWKDKQGQVVVSTDWHRVVAFKQKAEFVGQYIKKGSFVYVEGKLKTRKWDDNGVDRYTTEVVATDIRAMDKKPSSLTNPPQHDNSADNYDDLDDDN